MKAVAELTNSLVSRLKEARYPHDRSTDLTVATHTITEWIRDDIYSLTLFTKQKRITLW